MKRWMKTLPLCASEIIFLLLLHWGLLHYLADHHIASKILGAGKHVPRSVVVTALTFIVVRLLSVLALPGMILSRLGLVVMDLMADRRG